MTVCVPGYGARVAAHLREHRISICPAGSLPGLSDDDLRPTTDAGAMEGLAHGIADALAVAP